MVELWLPEKGREFREKVDSSRYSDGFVPITHFRETFNQLSVWPLFEEMHIVSNMLERPISCKSQKRLQDLIDEDSIYLGGAYSGLLRNASTREYSINVIKPGDLSGLEQGLDAIGTCYDNPEHDKTQILDRFMKDISFGGTLIFFLMKDEKPVVYNKLFYGISRNNEPILYYDAMENGDFKAKSVYEWDGRIDELLFSFGSAVQMAKDLDILAIGMGEREAEELAFEMGCPNHYFLQDNLKKAGYPIHPKNKGDVVYQARVFGKRSNKPKVFDLKKMQSGTRLIQDFQKIYDAIKRTDFSQNSRKYDSRVLYLALCNKAIRKMETGTQEKRDLIQAEFNEILNRKGDYVIPYLDA